MAKGGTVLTKNIPVFFRPDGTVVHLPMMAKETGVAGPRIFFIGVVHGNEPVGAEVIHRIFKDVPIKCGSLYAIPVVNISGFASGTREVSDETSLEHVDLNRIFPGNENGNGGERIAAAVVTAIQSKKPNFVFDFHADAPISDPFVIIDRQLCNNENVMRRTRAMANVFGITVCNEVPNAEYRSEGLDCSLTGFLMNKAKIPSAVIELGAPTVVHSDGVRVGLNGVKNVLHELGMLDGRWTLKYDKRKISLPYELRRETILATGYSGKITYEVCPGERVVKYQRIATIDDLFGVPQNCIVAPKSGTVLSLGYSSCALQGSVIAQIAVRDE